MQLKTYNQCVDRVTGVNKTAPYQGRTGSAHAGDKESLMGAIRHLWVSKGKNNAKHAKVSGRHKKVAGRHAAPRRSFF